MRDFLIELAVARLFQDEWIENLLRKRPDLAREHLERTRALMERAVPDCLVEGYENLIGTLALPDADDRHVLAAAIKGACTTIVTFNLADFPAPELRRHGVEAHHPDDLVHRHFEANHTAIVTAARRCRARLKFPERSAGEYLETLERQGLAKIVAGLSAYAGAL